MGTSEHEVYALEVRAPIDFKFTSARFSNDVAFRSTWTTAATKQREVFRREARMREWSLPIGRSAELRLDRQQAGHRREKLKSNSQQPDRHDSAQRRKAADGPSGCVGNFVRRRRRAWQGRHPWLLSGHCMALAPQSPACNHNTGRGCRFHLKVRALLLAGLSPPGAENHSVGQQPAIGLNQQPLRLRIADDDSISEFSLAHTRALATAISELLGSILTVSLPRSATILYAMPHPLRT